MRVRRGKRAGGGYALPMPYAVAYWCPALRAGAGGQYVLGQYPTALLAQQWALWWRTLGGHAQAYVVHRNMCT